MDNNIFSHNPKKLGFGLMRLPASADDVINYEQTGEMIDMFMQRGFTYFDTAYVYHGGHSEEAVKTLLSSKYPRDSFTLATKLPLWNVRKPEDIQQIFDQQLARTGAVYFDYYLLHALNTANISCADRYDIWPWAQKMKEQGLIKHVGFSFHDSAEVFDKLLCNHPEMEFVQLQINYIDWDSDAIQSRLCYEVARKHNKPVIVMEPIKGGSLAECGDTIKQMFAKANPAASLASWALRYVMSLEGVFSVLSGMSNLAQLKENMDTVENFVPLSAAERAALEEIIAELKKAETVPCTRCNYCYEACPQKINTAEMITYLNDYIAYKYISAPRRSYGILTSRGSAKASECIECGACDAHCPQGIKVTDVLKRISSTFES